MNGITGAAPRPITITTPPTAGQGVPSAAAQEPDQQARAGQGALQGREVAVGNGEARTQTLAAPAHPVQPPVRPHKAFAGMPSQALAALVQPLPGGLAAREAVLDRLEQHAQDRGTPLGRSELRQLVAMGEHLAGALMRGEVDAGNPGQLNLQVGGQNVTVNSGVASTRALAWFMMAGAANQDAVREAMGGGSDTSDMVTNGSFLMKDEGNRVFNFLNAAPTCTARISTHFNERADHTERHTGLIGKGQPLQRGIEDFDNLMPGQAGAMLFDKLKGAGDSQELFVKIEQVGCPSVFKKEAHEEGAGKSISRFFVGIGRNLKHIFNFLNTRSQGAAGAAEVRRQEHVYKGVVKETIAKPFAELMNSAREAGLVGEDARAIGKSVKRLGLPFVMQTLAQVHQRAAENGNQGLVDQVEDLYRGIDTEMTRLGLASDRHGIERRGAEVHISLDPARQADPAATTLSADVVRRGMQQPLARQVQTGVLDSLQQNLHAPAQSSERKPAGSEGDLQYVSDIFARDLNRNRGGGYVIGQDVMVSRDDNFLELGAKALVGQCANHAQAMVVSAVATQSAMADFLAVATPSGGLRNDGDDFGVPIMPFHDVSRQRYSIMGQPDGSVIVHIEFHTSLATVQTLGEEGMGQAAVDPGKSRFTVRMAIRVGTEEPNPSRTLVGLDGSENPGVFYDFHVWRAPVEA